MSLDKIVVRTRYVDLLLDALGTDLFTFAPRKNSLTAFEGDSSMKDILLLESLGFWSDLPNRGNWANGLCFAVTKEGVLLLRILADRDTLRRF